MPIARNKTADHNGNGRKDKSLGHARNQPAGAAEQLGSDSWRNTSGYRADSGS